jgi:hemerythrin-like domain-containing protein
MLSLPQTTHEHHERIEFHVDRLPILAEMIGRVTPAELSESFEKECAFVNGQLVPHMAAIETALYGELQRLMENRHSMAPMRREHDQLRQLIQSLCEYRTHVAAGTLSPAEGIGLRRVLYRLYALLKVHLAEEELYLRVLDHNLSPDEKDVLARGIDHAVAQPL